MIEGQVAGTHGRTAGGQGRIRAAVAHPWVRELAVLVAFLAAGVAATWPLPSYITGRLPPANHFRWFRHPASATRTSH
jgi:hypothetical protein